MFDNYNFKYKRVFEIFSQISAIPHGSGNMEAISDYVVDFARRNGLRYIKDSANNVVVYKEATSGFEKSEPVILQGHLDMVCQKTAESDFDFSKDGLELFIDGDFLKAKDTTLGADNGIAAAMIMAILESNDISHPYIEAVFTTDEEIGMIGAGELDISVLRSKRMINLDSEEEDVVTVSCAGGSDFRAIFDISKEKFSGQEVTVTLKGLLGGHSGVEIDKGRVNANILAGRLLSFLSEKTDFQIISINGGDKPNAIPNLCVIKLCCENSAEFKTVCEDYLNQIKAEIKQRESNFEFLVEIGNNGEFDVLSDKLKKDIIYVLNTTPNGVLQMSAEIEGLVETSLNLGILKTDKSEIIMHYALRSNKASALSFLNRKMKILFSVTDCKTEEFGYYPPWEYRDDSKLREIYCKTYNEKFGKEPKIEAIHAGLECAVFSSSIKGLDCIAIGPSLFDVHTVNEKMSISSAERIFSLILSVLENCK
ncbi:MAG: aminoacyl-histidine dipeptidase [Clostridia bacterium]|nr:aminoacyl-histidine dipeptidase [Clostridia bacterium]